MEGITTTPVENSVRFLRLRDKYKSDLLEDSRLTKAAGLAAKQEMLLESPNPDAWKEPRLKSVSRELRQWVKKIRQPGGTRTIGREDSEDEDARNLAVGPMQQFMGNIAKIQKGIKRKASSPGVPQTPVYFKPSPQTPSTSKKVSFKTGSKGKRLLPKTPKSKTPKRTLYKTPEKSSEELAKELPFSEQVGQSPWKSPGELARESIHAIRRRTRKAESEERKKEGLKQSVLKTATKKALKKLAPTAGWKPFGTPTKRKLDGKDW